MTARAFSEVCARCDGPMVAKPDAIGRIRVRCPKCDGVSAPVRRHPDDAMIPQGLVHLVSSLPPVRPGQLRCQGCAKGVTGTARWCDDCAAAHRRAAQSTRGPASFAAKACLRCGLPFQPVGPNSRYCEGCK